MMYVHNMKKYIFTLLGLFLCIPISASANTLLNRVQGHIVLQTQQHGEAWYVNPSDHRRYYLGRPDDAFAIMQHVGVGITNANLEDIPTINQTWIGNESIMHNVQGKIVLQVESHGEAWYVNPLNGKRYYMGRPDDAFKLMTQLGHGITDTDLFSIKPNIYIQSISATEATINNSGPYIQNMKGWYVTDAADRKHKFKKNKQLEPGQSIHINIINSGAVELYSKNGTHIDTYSPITASEVSHDIQFTTQAPFGNWGSPFSEACEEAILVMLHHYYQGTDFSANDAQSEILSIVDWEMKTYGHHQDTSADETARTAREVYGLNATVSYDVSEDRIKQLLTEHKLVIAPVYGKYLYNPHFKNGGPYYHMILITGYEGNDFITHDPGTRYGENYRYSIDVMMNAIHDLASPESNGYNSPRAIVIVE